MDNSIELQIKTLREQKNTITENIEMTTKEMGYSLSNLTKYKDLSRQIDEYFNILKQIDNKIELLESNSNLSVRLNQQHTISQNLSKIDFKTAKDIVNRILEQCLGEQGGTASFLLQNTSSMRGDLCVADIQYSLSSNSYGRFKYCPIDPLLRPDISDKRSLLDAIADYFKPVEYHDNEEEYINNIISQISASVQGGSVVFFDFTNWNILENDAQILSWFIKYFWHPLKQKQPKIYEDYCWVRFILFISISSMNPESDGYLSYCCDHKNFDGLKMIELTLENWNASDIDIWLQNIYYELSKKKTQAIAEKIYQLSYPGIPVTVCSNLEKYLHKLLEA
ncbi:hypothetical protein PN483_19110 [Nodularia spumigena CS-591/04]|uniref:hypothetical protein n=1 Tax=Nodularia spumigena TaxID=70799 RepID=UPI00232CADC9|nr:hypothetical protein [Nodularia spumigena]MDB9319122.1 hypothetical protein [Nodularia spumigena CS-590/01A]MDB9326585.1 hypothetical protein [Nodularia spumigena CS-590/02]MDB9332567.1 hypothetical protein [Nodularia spumigena CS-591/04]